MENHRCCTMDHHWLLVHKQPKTYVPRALRIEREVQNWLRRHEGAGLRTGVIRIPVVVHVIYHRANEKNENVPDSHIHSQMRVLNADFRRLNADAALTPGVFRGVAADARLEFALAVRDPSGKPTNGITRTPTDVEGFVYKKNHMKAKATGGHDPWDVDQYLNIWVVHYLSESILGYGTRPPKPSRHQGVVLDYRAFGTIGNKLLENAELGRTATHEIGHWLDLIHIWGPDGNKSCKDSDNVRDTPNQRGATSFADRPRFPRITCPGSRPHGDMFMNYMDYSGDQFRNMFTAGQVARMHATLYTQRAGILDSQGLVPPIRAKQDLWIRNGPDDVGMEPDRSRQPMYASDDIWVRTTDDGKSNQDHENPVCRPAEPASNYVYVRVRNRGRSETGAGTVKLYWAKGSTGLSWPSPWDGRGRKPALGGLIGSKKVKVKPGKSKILVFPWSPPNPDDYSEAGADRSSFSLLARIETSDAAPFGMRVPETADLCANVRNNNNIAWKNVTIVNSEPRETRPVASLMVANFRAEAQAMTLSLRVPAGERPSILEWGRAFVVLPPSLIAARKSGKLSGVRRVGKRTFELVAQEAGLGTFKLAPGAMHALRIRLVPKLRFKGVHVLTLDLVQKVGKRVGGGQRIVIKASPDHRKITPDAPSTYFNGVDWVDAVKPVRLPEKRRSLARQRLRLPEQHSAVTILTSYPATAAL